MGVCEYIATVAMAGPYYQYIIKLLMVGAEKVGKTSLLPRFTEDTFNSDQRSTIGNIPTAVYRTYPMLSLC